LEGKRQTREQRKLYRVAALRTARWLGKDMLGGKDKRTVKARAKNEGLNKATPRHVNKSKTTSVPVRVKKVNGHKVR